MLLNNFKFTYICFISLHGIASKHHSLLKRDDVFGNFGLRSVHCSESFRINEVIQCSLAPNLKGLGEFFFVQKFVNNNIG